MLHEADAGGCHHAQDMQSAPYTFEVTLKEVFVLHACKSAVRSEGRSLTSRGTQQQQQL
jgi:hypothetical protein